MDRVFVATLDSTTGALALNDPGWVRTREAEGPRHIAFHPHRPLAYVVNELRSTVHTYRWNAEAGTLTPLQTLASTEPSTTGDTRAAEIAVSPRGGHVYASNRSGAGDSTPGGPDPDTLGVFTVEHHGGLKPVSWVSTQGIRPRFFGLEPSGRRLFAANEVTDTIVGYTLVTGAATCTPSASSPRPVPPPPSCGAGCEYGSGPGLLHRSQPPKALKRNRSPTPALARDPPLTAAKQSANRRDRRRHRAPDSRLRCARPPRREQVHR
ncbi:lactonase family protein [Streptomyces caeruleatus]|uniref:lactonase family protein n=1 Tax=Streptomyces caeruleatus TaxID=661399 RepID=UPI003CC66965